MRLTTTTREKSMPVNIHGKQYKTVAERINDFRSVDNAYNDHGIVTELVSDKDGVVIMKASVVTHDGRVMGTGYAEEVRGSTNINKTSALENSETSAIGRALANVGFGGTEYASANEVTDAILQQKVMEAVERLVAHNKAVVRNIEEIYQIKYSIANGDDMSALELAAELDPEDKALLWLAPTKGGIFTTQEREALQKTNKLKEAK